MHRKSPKKNIIVQDLYNKSREIENQTGKPRLINISTKTSIAHIEVFCWSVKPEAIQISFCPNFCSARYSMLGKLLPGCRGGFLIQVLGT